eukprot:1882357-Pyramimonas_sp.AAC.1
MMGGPHRVGRACSKCGGRVRFFWTGVVGVGRHRGVSLVSGWLPVALGRGSILLRNSAEPFPEG